MRTASMRPLATVRSTRQRPSASLTASASVGLATHRIATVNQEFALGKAKQCVLTHADDGTHHNTAGTVTLHSVYSSADGTKDFMRDDATREQERVRAGHAVPA